MASYRLEWRKSTKKDLRQIAPIEVERIVRAANDLAINPFPLNCKKLANSTRAYRVRVGDYRIIYEVFSDVLIVEVVRIAHRGKVYGN
ncbi:MAG: mRNA interferase RelE/StbE [Limisphaerales bacterium]|jgi:mRNA interferase RelE/StbE